MQLICASVDWKINTLSEITCPSVKQSWLNYCLSYQDQIVAIRYNSINFFCKEIDTIAIRYNSINFFAKEIDTIKLKIQKHRRRSSMFSLKRVLVTSTK